MDTNALVRHSPLPIFTALIAISVPACAQDAGLTQYERSLMCKLTETCGVAVGVSAVAQPGNSAGQAVDTQEAPFTVFNSGNVHVTPAQPQRSAQSSAAHRGPLLYQRGGKLPIKTAPGASQGLLTSLVGVHTVPYREHAGDVRVQFANDSAVLAKTDLPELDAYAHGLQAPDFAQLQIRIEGHTNAVGNANYNLVLSQRRAQAVADYLIAHGIGKDRIEAKGYGYESPRIAGAPRDARNRRVEIVKVN